MGKGTGGIYSVLRFFLGLILRFFLFGMMIRMIGKVYPTVLEWSGWRQSKRFFFFGVCVLSQKMGGSFCYLVGWLVYWFYHRQV